MSFFDLDPLAEQNQMEQARMTGVKPNQIGADFFQGAGTGLLNGLKTSFQRDLFNVTEPTNVEQRSKAIDRIQELRPDPTTVGTAGQFLHGMSDQLGTLYLNFMGGNVTPQLMAASSADSYAKSQTEVHMREGMDPATAESVAKIEGMGVGMGAVLPAGVAGGLGVRAASGAGLNLAFGAGQRAATQYTLNQAGYHDMARQYAPFDGASVATDILIGAFFGGALGERGAKANVREMPRVAPSDLDTGLAMNNAAHVEVGMAPGLATDMETRQAHVEASEKALNDMIYGEPVNVGDAVTQGTFIENPSAKATREEIVRVVDEHMGDDFRALQAELEARGLPTDTNLYSINGPREPLPPVRVTSEVGSIARKAVDEGWSNERLIEEVQSLHERLQQRNEASSKPRDRVRGPLWVEERLTPAERTGEMSSQEVGLVKFLLEKNPNLAEDLGLSIKQGKDDQVGGMYNPASRIMTIFTGSTDPLTAVHELLHHTERMMPQEIRAGIQRAWMDEVQRLQRVAGETGDTDIARAINDVLKSNMGDDRAHERVVDMVKDGLVGPEFYSLVNPSEFWAVNASKLVRERAKEGWVQKAVQWVKELVEKAKDLLGLRSDASVIRGLDAVLKSDGTLTGDVLAVGAPLKNVETPGVGVAQENKNGFEPDLRVKVDTKGIELPAKPLILTGSNLKNAARQIAEIDGILAKFPNAANSPQEWARMMAYAFGTDDVVIPPYRFIADMNSSGAVDTVKSLSKGQLADADHGFANAKEYFDLYTNGHMDVADTGKLLLWSFLSKGVSPYVQESMFIDAFKGIDPFIKLAGEGKFTKETLTDYYDWAATVASKGEGKPGAGTSHNLNGFGRDFLLKMNQLGEDGRTHLQRLHDLMSDPTKSGKDIRREFHTFAEGVGIDNKVLSFTLLVTGRTDVMVLDRVQFRHLWDDGRFNGKNLYDGRKVDGKPVAGSKLADLGDGVRGLFVYEAIESALQKRIENIYTAAGRPQDASIGRYHWESWVADSAQEASHGSINAVMRQVKGEGNPLSGVTAKEGQYDTRQYGARYGLDDQGVPTFRYPDSTGREYNFDLQSFRAMLDEMQKPASGVTGKDFKITDKRYENQPWFTRPDVNRDALDTLVRKFGRSGEEGTADGRPDQAALSDGAGSAGADPYGPEAVIANNPALTIVQPDGTMVSAGRALTMADAEIATAKQESQGFDAAIACALRG